MERSAGSKRRYFRVITFLVLVIGIANGCSKADDPSDGNGGNNGGNDQPGANEVWIKGMAYEPSTITITAGTTIKWTNKDDVVHTVTSDNGLFDSGNMTSSNTFSRQFPTAGTYSYHCTPHPTMTATIVVN